MKAALLFHENVINYSTHITVSKHFIWKVVMSINRKPTPVVPLKMCAKPSECIIKYKRSLFFSFLSSFLFVGEVPAPGSLLCSPHRCWNSCKHKGFWVCTEDAERTRYLYVFTGLFEVRAQEYLETLPGGEQSGVNKFFTRIGKLENINILEIWKR